MPHVPTQLNDELLSWAQLVICWEPTHKVELANLMNHQKDLRMISEVRDPFESGDYESAVNKMSRAITKLAIELLAA